MESDPSAESNIGLLMLLWFHCKPESKQKESKVASVCLATKAAIWLNVACLSEGFEVVVILKRILAEGMSLVRHATFRGSGSSDIVAVQYCSK